MEYDNLGIGYMSAVLSGKGFRTRVIDVRGKRSVILGTLKKLEPLLIGFSVIYQYNINKFADLIAFLRNGGINCHFTAGGHYASLKYEELFGFIPSLDSIVRLEGEYTLSELADCIRDGDEWRNLKGIAFKREDTIITNQLRSFEKDLDRFPLPKRLALKSFAFGMKFSTIIAGRGCIHNCSFCNTRKFYTLAGGQAKRIRSPEKVVQEMEMLYLKRNSFIFLFLDDDFPLRSPERNDWIEKFGQELTRTGLDKKTLWKINCRPDEVDENKFRLLKKLGLFLVFLGIEDGTDSGLKRLNKNMTVGTSLRAIKILKKLKIEIDIGFMPFQPDTSYKSLNENLNFLKDICSDGYIPATYLKMMPYYETRVEKQLIKEGRLKISTGIRDYDFLEESMNLYYGFVSDCFAEWLWAADGVENTANWARNYIAVYKTFFEVTPVSKRLFKNVRKIISESNSFLIDTMKELAAIYETRRYENGGSKLLEPYRVKIISKQEIYRRRIVNSMAKLITLVEYQQLLTYLYVSD